jgi:hypothetical protein
LKFSRSPSDKHFVSEVGEPAQPLEIKIVNAREIGAVEKILTVKRDDSGKLSGAVSQPIS